MTKAKQEALERYERFMDKLTEERKLLGEIRLRRDTINNEHAQKIEKIEGLKAGVSDAWKNYKDVR